MSSQQNEKQPLSRRVQAFLAKSRFATFSILLHVVIVVMAGSVVLFQHFAAPPDFTADGASGLVSTDAQVQPPPEQEQPTESFSPVAPTVSAPQLSAITSTSTTQTAFQMPTAVPQVRAPAMAQMNSDLSKMLQNAGSKGTGTVPAAMGGRMGGAARGQAMMKNGGKEAAERAVIAGLNWLKAHQDEDGSWSSEHKPGMTGLAVLCFLGHGETQTSADFGPTVKKAIDWLIKVGGEFDSHYSLTKQGWGGNEGVYSHAICAYALGEYYSMTQDERVKDVLTKAVKYIVDGQNENGGWKYGFAKGGESDISVTGWQVQALKAAHLTGLQMPGVDEALDKCMLFLKEDQAPDGGFYYQGKGTAEHYGLGGVGTLCTYFWKQDKDKLVHEGIKYIIDKTKNGEPVEYKSPKADLYGWYYNTQACLMFGGAAWTQWNRWFQDEIVNAQNKGDGSWPPMPFAGVGGLQAKADGSGPYYRTTLCILMLEVFYRYMPINK